MRVELSETSWDKTARAMDGLMSAAERARALSANREAAAGTPAA